MTPAAPISRDEALDRLLEIALDVALSDEEILGQADEAREGAEA